MRGKPGSVAHPRRDVSPSRAHSRAAHRGADRHAGGHVCAVVHSVAFAVAHSDTRAFAHARSP